MLSHWSLQPDAISGVVHSLHVVLIRASNHNSTLFQASFILFPIHTKIICLYYHIKYTPIFHFLFKLQSYNTYVKSLLMSPVPSSQNDNVCFDALIVLGRLSIPFIFLFRNDLQQFCLNSFGLKYIVFELGSFTK